MLASSKVLPSNYRVISSFLKGMRTRPMAKWLTATSTLEWDGSSFHFVFACVGVLTVFSWLPFVKHLTNG